MLPGLWCVTCTRYRTLAPFRDFLSIKIASILPANNKMIYRRMNIDSRIVTNDIGSSAPFVWWPACRPYHCVRSGFAETSYRLSLKPFLDTPAVFSERWEAGLAGGGRFCKAVHPQLPRSFEAGSHRHHQHVSAPRWYQSFFATPELRDSLSTSRDFVVVRYVATDTITHSLPRCLHTHDNESGDTQRSPGGD